LKSIVAIEAYADVCEAEGRTLDANRYSTIAHEHALQWRQRAFSNVTRAYVRAYNESSTWSLKVRRPSISRMLHIHHHPFSHRMDSLPAARTHTRLHTRRQHLQARHVLTAQTALLWDRLVQTYLFSDVILVECAHYANRTARGPYGLGVDSAYGSDATLASMIAVAAVCPSLQQV
jgi:hypothetical protein